jgi:Ca2+-binding EF-hand superfamily protein
MPKKANIFDSFSHSAIQQFKEAFGKMAGGSDDDDVILASFEAFEIDGKIDADAFRHSLMTFGVKFSASEVDDAFAEMKIDEGMIDAAHLKGLMVSK